MKYYLKIIVAFAFLFSCSDFEEVNTNPNAANEDQVQVEYFINSSISGAQMNPHISERIFVLYWRPAGRFDRTNTLPIGSDNDGWTSDYYSTSYLSGWLNNVSTAIEVADDQLEAGTNKEYTDNLKQVARIWRVYLMSEMADNFGPTPIDAFKGVNPDFNSVEDVYHFLLTELDEATEAIDENIVVTSSTVQEKDMAYAFNFTKWKKYGNSMRMRLAMRLSEVDPSTAQQHFEDAATGSQFIATLDDNFTVPEVGGWHDLTGVMTREWNHQILSPTLNNLMVGLGGVSSEDQLRDELHSHVKDEDYLGMRLEDHIATATNNPVAGFWLDGLPSSIDPRAYAEFNIPGDEANPEFNYYPTYSTGTVTTTERNLLNDDGSVFKTVDTKYHWNASSYGSWGEKGAKNEIYAWPGSHPRLLNFLRNSSNERIFFGSWESYFLVAEAALRGWNVPMNAQQAYEQGISESFNHWGVSQYLSSYINSDSYNRVGTSVAWDHTAEAADKPVSYIDGYTGSSETMTYEFPDNGVYDGGVNNDHLTKIITQKFIAQNPWVPLETWNDHRRLGLPFFENPAVENPLSTMPQLTQSNYMESRVEFFPQRLEYPASLANSAPEGYEQAVGFLSGEDDIFTPLWWAQH